MAAEHRVEVLRQGPPADALAKEIAAQLAPTGLKVIRGSKRTLCEIWLCTQWTARDNFQPTAEVLYPFQPGQLIGVVRFRRKGGDFRDQDIRKGIYTLRYAQQPVDGNHEGTSPTRDFLVLVQAEQDTSNGPLAEEPLMKLSAAAAESDHPAMFCLQTVSGKTEPPPSIHHNEDHDWWIIRLQGKAKAGAKVHNLVIDLVIAGHAEE